MAESRPLSVDDSSPMRDGEGTKLPKSEPDLTSVSAASGSAGDHTDLMDRDEKLDCDELEERFSQKMEAFAQAESKIFADFASWQRLFDAWATTTIRHENDRAQKRLKTQVAFAQYAERNLESKKDHYDQVVKAFESALALLR